MSSMSSMSSMSTEIFAEYMHLEAAKKQRGVDYIEELNKAQVEHREAKAFVL
jgi:hypothetical protein